MLIRLVLLTLALTGCKHIGSRVSEDEIAAEDLEPYLSEDVKWMGYFDAFAKIQNPLGPNEGSIGGNMGSPSYTWKTFYDRFVAGLAKSACGTAQVDPEFAGYYAHGAREMGTTLILFMQNLAGTGENTGYGTTNCNGYMTHATNFLKAVAGRRGASLPEIHMLHIMQRFPKMFFVDKVVREGGLNINQEPANIFTNKTTPSLDFNNEVAAIISKPATWEELGMSPNNGLMAYYGGKFIYKYQDTLLFQLSPLGSLVAAGDAWLDISEGRNAAGKTLTRGEWWKSAGKLGLNVILATSDAFMIKAGALKAYSKATAAAERIAARARGLEAKIASGGLTKAEVEEFQVAVKNEIDELAEVKGKGFDGSTIKRPSIVNFERARESLSKIGRGIALTEEEALELAAAKLTATDGKLLFNAKVSLDQIEAIQVSKRIWGTSQTASVFSTKTPISWSRLRTFFTAGSNNTKQRAFLLIFQGDAAKIFARHPIYGLMSGFQRLTGEFVSPFGDLIIDAAVRDGKSLIITKAHVASEAEVQFMKTTAAQAKRTIKKVRFATEAIWTVAGGSIAHTTIQRVMADEGEIDAAMEDLRTGKTPAASAGEDGLNLEAASD